VRFGGLRRRGSGDPHVCSDFKKSARLEVAAGSARHGIVVWFYKNFFTLSVNVLQEEVTGSIQLIAVVLGIEQLGNYGRCSDGI
jgi:hypothetical protein